MIRRPPRSTPLSLHDPLPISLRIGYPSSRRSNLVFACARTSVTSPPEPGAYRIQDRKSTRLNSSHGYISYAVFCLKKKKNYSQSMTSDNHAVNLPIDRINAIG